MTIDFPIAFWTAGERISQSLSPGGDLAFQSSSNWLLCSRNCGIAHPIAKCRNNRGDVTDLFGSHADDDGQAAWHVLRVNRSYEGDEVGRLHLIADFDTQGVADAPQELQVGTIQLPGALSTPQEVARAVVPAMSVSSSPVLYSFLLLQVAQ